VNPIIYPHRAVERAPIRLALPESVLVRKLATARDDMSAFVLQDFLKAGFREVEWRYGFEPWQNEKLWQEMGSVCPVCFALDGQRFKIDWLLQNMTHNAPKYTMSHVNCLPPGTEIMMSDGSVRLIESIRKGDAVLGHDGEAHLVTGTTKRKYVGDLVSLLSWGGKELLLTPNHRVYAQKGHLKYANSGGTVFSDWDFVPADDLEAGVRRKRGVSDKVYFPTVSGNSGCDLTDEQVELFGYWMAEGCTRLNRGTGERIALIFTIGQHEMDFANRIGALCSRLEQDSHLSIRKNGHATVVYWSSKKWTKIFMGLGGLGAREKKMAPEAMRWPIDKQRIFLNAFIRGDGHISNRNFSDKYLGRTQRIYITTHSKQLANQLYVMLDRLHVPVLMNETMTPTGPQDRLAGSTKKFPHYLIHFNRWSWDRVGKPPHTNSRVLVAANSVVSMLRSVGRVPYSGMVHNISVAGSQSYIANRIAVHNCECRLFRINRTEEMLDFSEKVTVAPGDIDPGLTEAPVDLGDVPEGQRPGLGLPEQENQWTDIEWKWDPKRNEFVPLKTFMEGETSPWLLDQDTGEFVPHEEWVKRHGLQ
jgi:hypothetical protein